METLKTAERIRYYLRQPHALPKIIEEEIQRLWGEDSIRLYAMTDLNARFEIEQGWVIIGRRHFAIATKKVDSWHVRSLPRDRIGAVKCLGGLSANRLLLSGADGDLLFELRYTQRQRKAMGHIVYVLEQQTESQENVLESESVEASEASAEKLYRDSTLSSIEETQNARSSNRLAVIWRLLGFLKPYQNQVILGMSGATLLTLVSLVPAFLTGYLFDHVIRPHQLGVLSDNNAVQMAVLAIAGLAATYLMREVFAWMRLRWMAVLGEYVARDLRNQVYTHLHKLSLSFFSSKQTGSLISRVGSDTDRIWDFIAFGVVEVTSSLLMLSGLSAVLLWLDWKLALIVVVPVPVLLWLIARHGQEMQRLFIRAWRKWSDLTDCLSDTIPGIRVVKAFNQQEREKRRFGQRNEATVQEFNRIHIAWTGFWPKLMLSIHLLVVAIWFFGVPRVLLHQAGSESAQNLGVIAEWMGPMTVGTFVSFVLYLTMFIQPIEIIGQMARMVNRATSSAHRVFEVLDTKPQLTELHDAIKLTDMQGEVVFDRVRFSYDGIRPIVKDVSLQVKPGEFIGLVGSSGGGKSTLINLIMRFYDVSSGQIRIDGVDVKDLDLEVFREQVGMVLQDPYLFHGTILENIRYSNPNAELHEVVAAAQAAHAHEFIMKFTHGYDSIVGERGHTLSGGERQRISIARAVLRNPKLLILDEATSAVDTETEYKIQEAIDRLVKGRTVIAIAHRLSTLRRADRLFVIKDGQVVESGRHEELLKIEGGRYAKLYRLQQKMHDG